jgi:hypothetical protein
MAMSRWSAGLALACAMFGGTQSFARQTSLGASREPVLLDERQRVGWWRVDPGSGETIGVMDTGFNVALTEKEINDLKAAFKAFLEKGANEARQLRALAVSGRGKVTEYGLRSIWMREAVKESLREMILLSG